MNTSALQAFVCVAENDSFSVAAEQLHLTQPAVSKRVATLEKELETPLFDRIGHKISLTEAGRQLLPRAQHMLLEMADIRRSISNLTGEVSGTLIMGTSHHIGLRRLPPALKEFSLNYPQVSLDIRFMDSESACNEVEHGELELAIVTLPTSSSPKLSTSIIWSDPLLFVIARDHPLATITTPKLEDLTHYPAVLAAKGTYTRGILEQALEPIGLPLQVGMATNYLETLRMMVSIGLGWSLLPESMVKGDNLRVLNIQELKLSRQLGSVTHRDRTLSNAARAMVEA
ncbi:MAG: LysR family transcriptional regulator, partial [Candidatus Sedimenticola sp. (ex Thyasira tokunagai)]